MAYIHVAIPLNISKYQHQCTLFDSYLQSFAAKTTDNPQHVFFSKGIRDLATFAYKRLDKLIDQICFIDIILPPDDFTQSLHDRHKRFLDEVLMPLLSNEPYPTTTSTTTPKPNLHKPFVAFPDNPPPSTYSYRPTRDTSQTYPMTQTTQTTTSGTPSKS